MPEMFDYLVSQCWRQQVRDGWGKEGQTILALTGRTFRVYSSPAKLPKNIKDGAVVYVTAGNYGRRWWEFWR